MGSIKSRFCFLESEIDRLLFEKILILMRGKIS